MTYPIHIKLKTNIQLNFICNYSTNGFRQDLINDFSKTVMLYVHMLKKTDPKITVK